MKNHRITAITILSFFILIFFGCQEKNLHASDGIDTIVIYTDLGTVNTPFSIPCDINSPIVNKRGYKFIIDNKEKVNIISKEIKMLTKPLSSGR